MPKLKPQKQAGPSLDTKAGNPGRSSLKKEFNRLVSAYRSSKSRKNLINIKNFSERGSYHNELVEAWLKEKSRANTKKNNKRKPLGTCLDEIGKVCCAKPLQGGAPGLGKKS